MGRSDADPITALLVQLPNPASAGFFFCKILNFVAYFIVLIVFLDTREIILVLEKFLLLHI
jgi:hypothetical protein